MNSSILKAERQKLGFTQKDIAALLHKSVSAYCKREVGIVDCTAEEIKVLKHTLNLSPKRIDEIFFKD